MSRPTLHLNFPHLSALRVVAIDGCEYDPTRDKWVQLTPPPRPQIDVHLHVTNIAAGPIQRPLVSGTFFTLPGPIAVAQGLERMESGTMVPMELAFPSLLSGPAALYLELLDTNPPWNHNPHDRQIGSWLAVAFETRERVVAHHLPPEQVKAHPPRPNPT